METVERICRRSDGPAPIETELIAQARSDCQHRTCCKRLDIGRFQCDIAQGTETTQSTVSNTGRGIVVATEDRESVTNFMIYTNAGCIQRSGRRETAGEFSSPVS